MIGIITTVAAQIESNPKIHYLTQENSVDITIEVILGNKTTATNRTQTITERERERFYDTGPWSKSCVKKFIANNGLAFQRSKFDPKSFNRPSS